jgi:hypothetical protein
MVKKQEKGMSEWYKLQWPYFEATTLLEKIINLRT